MATGCEIVGNGDKGEIVCTPEPVMLKLMVSLTPYVPTAATSRLTFAPSLNEVIASRRVTTPSSAIESPVLVTTTADSKSRSSSPSMET